MTKSSASRLWLAAISAAGLAAGLVLTAGAVPAGEGAPAAAKPDPARSVAAFRKVAEVLRHPRCLNCHPAGNFPRQTDQRAPHHMGVQRGADDHGLVGMRCASCHSDENVDEVPGAPHWGLAPIAMAWEGLDDAQLAEALKDPVKNGKRSLAQLYDHMAHDKLVAWAWAPGGTRQPPPVSHEEFARLVAEWIDNGAVTPPAGSGTPVKP